MHCRFIKNSLICIFMMLTSSMMEVAASQNQADIDYTRVRSSLKKALDQHCEIHAVSNIHQRVSASSATLILENNGHDSSLAAIRPYGTPGTPTKHYSISPSERMSIENLSLERELPDVQKELFGASYGVSDARADRFSSRSKTPVSRYQIRITNISDPDEAFEGKHRRLKVLGREIRVHDVHTETEIAIRREYMLMFNSVGNNGILGICPDDGLSSIPRFLLRVFEPRPSGELIN